METDSLSEIGGGTVEFLINRNPSTENALFQGASEGDSPCVIICTDDAGSSAGTRPRRRNVRGETVLEEGSVKEQ